MAEARRAGWRRSRFAWFGSVALHGIVLMLVAGKVIERPDPSQNPHAISVTLLADGAEAGPAASREETGAPATAAPVVDPEPTARVPSTPRVRAPAPTAEVTPSPESRLVEAPPTADGGDASDENRPSVAESDAVETLGLESESEPLRGSPGSGGARLYGEDDVDRVAGPVGGIRRPSYPARERLLGREGRVSLLVTVDPHGVVSEVAVTSSAGEAFDAAARRAVEATPFRPAERSGLAVASTVTVNVSFELD